MKTNIQRRSICGGHILLPLFGFVYWFPLIMIALGIIAALLVQLGKATHPLLAWAIGIALYFIGMPVLTISLAILAEGLEGMAMRIGLGCNQYWTGAGWFEKVSREVCRAAVMFGAAGLAVLLLPLLVADPWRRLLEKEGLIIVMAGCALWQLAVVVLHMGLASIKSVYPGFGWFKGDPKAYYPHVF